MLSALRYNAGLLRANGTPFFTGDGSATVADIVDRQGNPIRQVKQLDEMHRTDWEGRQLLHSTARTNLLTGSSDLSTGWTNVSTAAGSAANAGLAPDGSMTAYKIVAMTNTSRRQQTGIAIPENAVYTAAVFLSNVNSLRSRFAIFANTAAASVAWVYLTWSGSTPTIDTAAGSLVPGSSSVELMPDGINWKVKFDFRPTNSDGSVVYDNASVLIYPDVITSNSSILAWGAGIYDQYGAYIPTTTAARTITDYVLSDNTVTFGDAPVSGAVLDWTGVAKR